MTRARRSISVSLTTSLRFERNSGSKGTPIRPGRADRGPLPGAVESGHERETPMKRRCVAALGLALVAATMMWPARTAAADNAELAFNQNCQLCHNPERVRAKRLTREEWQQIIKKMIGLGCPIRSSKRNQDLVLDYLVRTQAPAGAAVAQARPAPTAAPVIAQAQPASNAGPAARVYVVNEESQDVWVLDAATRAVVGSAKVEKLPRGITPSPDGTSLYVTNMGSNDVTIIDTATLTTTTMHGTGLNPHESAMGPDGRWLYVSNPSSNTVTVHDTISRVPVASIPVGRFPHGVALSPDGKRLYVANRDTGDVSVIDTTMRQVVATISTAPDSRDLAVSPDGKTLYVVSTNPGLLSFVDTIQARVVKSVKAGR